MSTVLGSAQNQNSERKLKQVIEDFRTSIIEHDSIEKIGNLFLHDSITWAAIFTNKTKKAAMAHMPDFRFHSTDYKTFYTNLKEKSEEKFYNLKIDERGEFATISFDYSLSIDSKVQNWGTEYWSLMLVNGIWKITSVTWTMNNEEIEKCPFSNETPFRLD
ncbi:nuclear transport factor 2 family protein [Croceitalea sp. MTPC5]|uniref:nuclear transport factor 2 family protein n=1 Tax=Croceitalea sp. MTPC5 TaxID=3056565 RepID=UPI0030D4950F